MSVNVELLALCQFIDTKVLKWENGTSSFHKALVAQSFSFAPYFLRSFRRSSHAAENNHVKGNPQRAAETEAWKGKFI